MYLILIRPLLIVACKHQHNKMGPMFLYDPTAFLFMTLVLGDFIKPIQKMNKYCIHYNRVYGRKYNSLAKCARYLLGETSTGF